MIPPMDISASALFSSLIIGSLGMFLFMWGKRSEKPLYLVIGLGMCVYPYFIPNQIILWAVTGLLLIPIYTLSH